MVLSRRVLDAYNAAVKRQGDNAEGATRKALRVWFSENPDASIAETREFCIALMRETGTVFGGAAGDAAYALYDEIARAAGIDGADEDYAYEPDPEYVDKTARYQVEKLKDGDRDGFADAIADAARYFAERGANDTMVALAAMHAKKHGGMVRFARVPTGATTCPYCIMLASRGFVYGDETKALNANHRHCDCRIIPGKPGMTVEGYDPDAYYEMWKHPERYEGAQTVDVSEFHEEAEDETELVQHVLKIIEGSGDLVSEHARSNELAKELSRLERMMSKAENGSRLRSLKKEHDELRKELNSLQASLTKAHAALAEAIRKVVSLKRKLGVQKGKTVDDYLNMQCSPIVRKTVEQALRFVPTDWLEALSTANVAVRTVAGVGVRSEYDSDDNTIYIGRDEDKLGVVHELIHALEEHPPSFFDACQEFFERKTQGKPAPVLLSELTGVDSYDEDEYAYDMGDNCIDKYAFKEYLDETGSYTGFEVATVGVECLYRKPWVFLKDSDHLLFVLRLLGKV